MTLETLLAEYRRGGMTLQELAVKSYQLGRRMPAEMPLNLDLLERKAYEQAIVRSRGISSIAMRLLGVPRTTYFRRAEALGVRKKDERRTKWMQAAAARKEAKA